MSNVLKRSLALLLTLCMGAAIMAGCGGSTTSSTNTGSQGGAVSDSDMTTDTGSEATGTTESETGNTDASAAESGKGQQTTNTNSTGTASGNKNNTTGKTSSTGTTGNTTTGKKTLIIFDDQKNTALAAAALAYQKQHPDVTIQIKQGDSLGGRTTLQGLKLDSRSNNAADIVNMDYVYLGAAAKDGLLRSVDEYGYSKISGQFMKSIVDGIKYKGKTYGVPFDANTICLVYNKEIFNAAGAKAPTTYDEMVEAGNKIKAKYGTEKYAYTAPFAGWTDKNWIAFDYFLWLWRMGGEILNEDMTKATFNSDAGVEALNKMIDLKNKGLASPKYQHYEFQDGQTGMMEFGSWSYENLFGADKKADFGVTMLPVLKAGVPAYSGLGVYCYAVTSASKNPELAYDFIQFYCTSKTYQLQFCKQNNFIPSLTAAQSDSFYQKDIWQVMIKQLQYAKGRPSVPNWESMEKVIASAVEEAAKTGSAKEALDAAAVQVDKLLARNK